jgi:hypothetical protein
MLQRGEMMMRVLDPTGYLRVARSIELSPRLETLEGCTLGVVINEAGSALATNWDSISRRLERLLNDQFGPIRVHREVKSKMSAPAPPEFVRRVGEKTQAVINGLGK